MIVTCPNCTTRLQLDDAKIPARAFSVRCPKCQLIIETEPPAAVQKKGAAIDAAGHLPSTTRTSQQETSSSFMPYVNAEPQSESSDATQTAAATGDSGDLIRLLASVLQRALSDESDVKVAPAVVETAGARRPVWDNRRVLVCIGSSYRDKVVRALSLNNHRLIVAEDGVRALEHMREEKVDVLLLDPEFDVLGQGASLITRELSAMRMADRRRLVLVQFSPTTRTGDVHAAFVNNVNLIINKADAGDLPQLLEKNVRELNDLYREFNKSLNLTAL